MLSESQIKSFHENGYLKVGQVLTDEQLEALREGLDRVLAGETENKPELLRNLAGGDIYSNTSSASSTSSSQSPSKDNRSSTQIFSSAVVIQIVNIWEADRAYFEHIYHPEITQMVAQLCNTNMLRVWHDQIQYKPSLVGAATGWHQDYPAWPILEPGDLVSAWVALDDATIENGCMRMVPGSYRWGAYKLRTGENFELSYDPSQLSEGAKVEVVPIEVKAGACAFHHCLTWHGSPKNPSPKKRRAIAVHYMPGYTRFVPRGRHAIDHRVEVKPGEILAGKYFPVVYDNGPLGPPDTIL